jgi:hypothetical protein
MDFRAQLVLRNEGSVVFFAFVKTDPFKITLGDDLGQVDADFFDTSVRFYNGKTVESVDYNCFYMLSEYPLVKTWLQERNLVQPNLMAMFQQTRNVWM